MIIKGAIDKDNPFRKSYPVDGAHVAVNHFAERKTTESNPFKPHSHEQEEFWFMIEGKGILFYDGKDLPVEAGDLVHIESGIIHGITSVSGIRWICIG